MEASASTRGVSPAPLNKEQRAKSPRRRSERTPSAYGASPRQASSLRRLRPVFGRIERVRGRDRAKSGGVAPTADRASAPISERAALASARAGIAPRHREAQAGTPEHARRRSEGTVYANAAFRGALPSLAKFVERVGITRGARERSGNDNTTRPGAGWNDNAARQSAGGHDPTARRSAGGLTPSVSENPSGGVIE